MVQALIIKITRTLPTFAITKLTLEWMLGGIFLLLVTEKVLVMALVALWSAMWVCVSLQMLSGQTSTSSNEMFNLCKERISVISFIYVSAEDVEKHSRLIDLEKCYESASTVPGTRSYHCFIPTSTNELQLKWISADPYHSNFQFGKTKTRISLNDIIPGQYYTCMHDDDWYIGIANDHLLEYQDVHFKFLKKNISNNFSWPSSLESVGFLSQTSSAKLNLWKLKEILLETSKLHRKNLIKSHIFS